MIQTKAPLKRTESPPQLYVNSAYISRKLGGCTPVCLRQRKAMHMCMGIHAQLLELDLTTTQS